MHLRMRLEAEGHPSEHEIWIVRTEETVELEVDGETYEATVDRDDDRLVVTIDGRRIPVEVPADDQAQVAGHTVAFDLLSFEPGGAPGEHDTLVQGEGAVQPPMPGKIASLEVQEGDQVEQGQTVAVLEAMKMRSSIEAPRSGTVLRILVEPGQAVEARDILLEIGDPDQAA